MAKKKPNWTTEEIDLVCNSQHRTFKELLALLPGRSAYALRQKMFKYQAKCKDTRGTPPWTEEQIRYLLNNYQKKTTKQIANHVGKSISSVTQQCKKLGIKVLPRAGGGPTEGMVVRHWTSEEKKKLLWYSSTMSMGKLAQAFGRSKFAISNMAWQLGIDRKQGTYSINAVAEILGVSYGTVTRYRDQLGQIWGTYNRDEKTIEPGATIEQIQSIAGAILANPRTMTSASAKRLRSIASGDWDYDPLIDKAA